MLLFARAVTLEAGGAVFARVVVPAAQMGTYSGDATETYTRHRPASSSAARANQRASCASHTRLHDNAVRVSACRRQRREPTQSPRHQEAFAGLLAPTFARTLAAAPAAGARKSQPCWTAALSPLSAGSRRRP